MFERFSSAARRAVVEAQEHARALHAPEVGAEHLLLAVASLGDPVAAAALADLGLDGATLREEVQALSRPDAAALRTLGIDPDDVRRRAEEAFGAGALDSPAPTPARRGPLQRLFGRDGGHIRFSGAAKEALENSLRECLALHHDAIRPEHLLLGLLSSGRTPVAHLVRQAGVDPAAIRSAVLDRLRGAA
ncbi:ATP-dependent Clp protease ATP-binding subunit ClpC [Kineococcus xinjiangensis]|uniref:ATP-dependent Clp protease ATP-binding subunit ClpC n=1 Tax=Kineococcus xinjiangensis TaxID=512762 RepID=A0A2S6IVT7_9ACTN|nr:Clp protease N-terminal domain-containing protein [Kineococcus xinjiangensis]PPK98464.1 ATP-dependent Clp protease ATP-binding subunit ClpC [Kineococcus xinjiangensis]